MTELTERFDRALLYASHVHGGQLRKGTTTPYIAHLLAVASLALEAGASEDQAIAALLHDADEDQGGHDRLRDIRARFGDRVAEIVDGCTDAHGHPKPEWRQRKERYLASLEGKVAESLLVSLVDKIHNAEAIVTDAYGGRKGLWKSFKGGKHGTFWYYDALAAAFERLLPGRMSDRLRRAVEQMRALVQEGAPAAEAGVAA